MTSGLTDGETAAAPGVGSGGREPELNKTTGAAVMFRRPANPVLLSTEPQLASWNRAGHPSQLRLASFLAQVDAAAAPLIATVDGRLAVELIVGRPASTSLTDGGRDLDNYLYPVAQRLGPARVAAMFGRKIHGPSWLAVESAQPDTAVPAARFATRVTGSYARKEWKETLRDRLLKAEVAPAGPGPVAMEIAVTTGPGRNWANIWKLLIDAFGPVLGEDPGRPFHPRDDRITSLGLHHHIDTGIGHDVVIEGWWVNL